MGRSVSRGKKAGYGKKRRLTPQEPQLDFLRLPLSHRERAVELLHGTHVVAQALQGG